MTSDSDVSTRTLRQRRNDIQGLRAIAVLLVAFSHAGISWLAGGYVGVDVFFVISGFLITGLLLGEATRTGRISLAEFYTRRARRILPAATLTIIATTIAARFLLNVVRAKEAISDSIWASVFAANIHFAARGTDYFAKGAPPSPFQHYWSLSVEEQFYVVWPTMVGLLAFGIHAHRRHRPGQSHRSASELPLGRIALALGAVLTASLAWSIHATSSTPGSAYFSTFTRVWELALGALLAVGAQRVAALPHRVRIAMTWVGLVAIFVAALSYKSGTPFPGVAALLPTVGAALVLGGGIQQRSRGGAGALLSVQPLRYIGDLSYSFYLWHWPVLVIAEQYVTGDLSLTQRLGLLAGAFALSALTYHLFERPIHTGKRLFAEPRDGLLLWPVTLTAVLCVALWGQSGLQAKTQQLTASSDNAANDLASPSPIATPATAGSSLSIVAAALQAADSGTKVSAAIQAAAATLADDKYVFPGNCIARGTATRADICPAGDTTAAQAMVVFGDSHAQMWMDALDAAAKAAHVKLLPLAKQSCSAQNWAGYKKTSDCSGWYTWATGQLTKAQPARVLIASDNMTCAGVLACQEAMARGLGALVDLGKAAGASVTVLGDVPGVSKPPADCLLGHGATLGSCTYTLAPSKQAITVASRDAARQHGASFTDVTPWFCSGGRCPDVIANGIAYFDVNHVTRSYARRLEPILASSLALKPA